MLTNNVRNDSCNLFYDEQKCKQNSKAISRTELNSLQGLKFTHQFAASIGRVSLYQHKAVWLYQSLPIPHQFRLDFLLQSLVNLYTLRAAVKQWLFVLSGFHRLKIYSEKATGV